MRDPLSPSNAPYASVSGQAAHHSVARQFQVLQSRPRRLLLLLLLIRPLRAAGALLLPLLLFLPLEHEAVLWRGQAAVGVPRDVQGHEGHAELSQL
jgi:hypothetical protein